MAKDLETQLRIQQEINKALRERNQLLTEAANAAGRQSEMFQKVGKSIQNNTDQLEEMSQMDFAGGLRQGFEKAREDIVESFDSIREGADDVADSLSGGFGGALSKASGALGKFGGFAKGAGAAIGVVGVGAAALGAKLMSAIGGIFGFLGSAAGAVVGVLQAAIGLVSGVFGGLIDLAVGGGGGGGLRQAIEEVRKEFGSLANNEGAALMKSFKRMRGFFNTVTGTGLSMRRVFGSTADRLKALHELAKAAGPSFSLMTEEFTRTGDQILELSKGLRITEDAFKGVGIMAQVSGKGIQESMLGIANISIRMGETLGMNTILITKNIATMSADFEHFGTLSQMELGRTAAVTAKLGMDVKELTGLIEKFDNFEDAAKSANMLSQAFGIQIDAMGMLKERDPSMRLKHLQQQFKATGRSIESMSRQELKLLASHTGLNAEQAALAFSANGLSMNYDDITAAAQDAEGQTLTQAEAMGKLADSIDRMVQGGGGRPKGFFDAFGRGFLQSVRYSGPFMELMRSIRQGLRETMRAGRRVGRVFTDSPFFKGVMDFLNDFFDPERIDGYLEIIETTLTNFLRTVTTDPLEAFNGLYGGIKKLTGKFRENTSNDLDAVIDGGIAIGPILEASLYSALSVATDIVSDGIIGMSTMIREFFLEGESPDAAMSMPGDGQIMSSMGNQVDAAYNSMRDNFRAKFPGLVDNLKTLFRDLYREYGPRLAQGLSELIEMIRPELTRLAGQIGSIIYDGIVMALGSTSIGSMLGLDEELTKLQAKRDRARREERAITRVQEGQSPTEMIRQLQATREQVVAETNAASEEVTSTIAAAAEAQHAAMSSVPMSTENPLSPMAAAVSEANDQAAQEGSNIGETFTDEARAAVGAQSPSTEMQELGHDIVAGLVLGISEGFADGSVVTAFEQLSTSAQPFFDSISTFAEGIVAVPEGLIGAASTNMTAVVTELGNFRDVLARPGALPSLGTTMKNIGQAMAVSAQNIQIHNTPINVNAEFNVTVDGKRLANGLARTGVVVAKSAGAGQMRISHGNSGIGGARDVTLKNT